MTATITPRAARLRTKSRQVPLKPRTVTDRVACPIRAGLSAERRAAFLAALVRAGSLEEAVQATGIDRGAVLATRARDAMFARAFDAAQDQRLARIETLLLDKAIAGLEQPEAAIADKVGEAAVRYSTNLGMWLLEARLPHRYGKGTRAAAAVPEPQRTGGPENDAAHVARLIAEAEQRLIEAEAAVAGQTSGG
jgi:hypothetical protein